MLAVFGQEFKLQGDHVMLGIERLGAALAAQCGLVGPMSTILMGIVILGEPFTPWLAVGTLRVFTGVWLLARWR